MTQEEWAVQQLNESGIVTRNQALQNNITRLGAIIHLLKRAGLDIVGKYNEGDYVYSLNNITPHTCSNV